MTPATRLACNTISQYIRTIANVLLSLIATRLILNALGSNDFGIYSLVAGVVSMLSFFTNALTTTTQRYLSFNSGKSDIILLREYFFNSIIIHLALGILIILLMIGIMPFLFNGFLNIDLESRKAAKLVYISLVIMMFIALMASPFKAVLISRENIIYISVIDIIDGILKLIVGYILYLIAVDRLVWYSIFMTFISLFNIIAFSLYGLIFYSECKHLKISYINKNKIRELTCFAGWTIYGTLCLFGRVQGLAIILNKFFNTIINAAYGISLQVSAALNSISGALQTALAPQLIKAEGNNQRNQMLALSEFGCKMSFILMSFIAIPIIYDINKILSIWLKQVPTQTAFFCVVLILANLIDQITVGLNTTMNAVGKIRNYMLVVNTLKFTTVFFIALLLYFSVPLHITFIIYLVIEFIGSILRLYFCKKYVGLNIRNYIKRVPLKLLLPVSIITLMYAALRSLPFSLTTFIVKFIILSIIYSFLIYKLSLGVIEKQWIKKFISSLKDKIIKINEL